MSDKDQTGEKAQTPAEVKPEVRKPLAATLSENQHGPDDGSDRSRKIARRFIGEILIDSGLITESQLNEAIRQSKAEGKRLGKYLVESGRVTDIEVAVALSSQLKLPFMRVEELILDPEAINSLSRDLVNTFVVLPYKVEGPTLTIITANPLDMRALDDIRFATGMSLRLIVAPENDMLVAIERNYPAPGLIREAVGENEELIFSAKEKDQEEDLTNLSGLSDQPPIIRFVNAIFSDAIGQGASDIHIEPHRYHTIVRFRVDGVIREVMKVERNIHLAISSRIKILSKLDISKRRIPQDGKLQINYKGNSYDLRVSTLPTSYGEKVTIRILSSVGGPANIDGLYLASYGLEILREVIKKPQGIILVTGPTGSGKSTTLYTCLKTVMSPDINIVTLENPVEYQIEGVNQVEVNPAQGLTFAGGLRSILRQDPDIVLLGEIRDEETAHIAFHAAQTGHLVLSTLHTNSAALSISRLLDLGIDGTTIGSTVLAVVGQRLVRCLCDACKKPDEVGQEMLDKLPAVIRTMEGRTFFQPVGCNQCNSTGYKGRLGIHEVLQITPKLGEMIGKGATVREVEEYAMKSGFTILSTDGMIKAARGLTSLSEVYRVAPPPVKEYVEITTDALTREEVNAIDLTAEDSLSVSTVQAKRILVVDDEEFIKRLIQGILEGEGYTVITAENGKEALKIAMKEKPDLILTDYNMPEMDGITLITELKARLATAYIPVMILTGNEEENTEVEGINVGAEDYIHKPINERVLMARVNRVIRKTDR